MFDWYFVSFSFLDLHHQKDHSAHLEVFKLCPVVEILMVFILIMSINIILIYYYQLIILNEGAFLKTKKAAPATNKTKFLRSWWQWYTRLTRITLDLVKRNPNSWSVFASLLSHDRKSQVSGACPSDGQAKLFSEDARSVR